MESKRYKVYSHYTGSERVPMIRMQGKWLKKAGFGIGMHLSVEYEDGRIIITPGKEDPVADASPEELSRMLTPAQKKQLAAKVREMISKNI